jgi:hypothetical protein
MDTFLKYKKLGIEDGIACGIAIELSGKAIFILKTKPKDTKSRTISE